MWSTSCVVSLKNGDECDSFGVQRLSERVTSRWRVGARARESESARERARARERGRRSESVVYTSWAVFELDEGEEGRVSCILMCFKILIKLFKLIEKF